LFLWLFYAVSTAEVEVSSEILPCCYEWWIWRDVEGSGHFSFFCGPALEHSTEQYVWP
jgi:hypothetical protein